MKARVKTNLNTNAQKFLNRRKKRKNGQRIITI